MPICGVGSRVLVSIHRVQPSKSSVKRGAHPESEGISHASRHPLTVAASHTIPEHISAPDLPFLSVDRPDLFMPDLRIAQVEATEPKRVLDAMYEGEL